MNKSFLGGIIGGVFTVVVCGTLIAANVPGARLARGFIFRGTSAGIAGAFDANNNGQILIGDGTDLLSSDVTGDIDVTSAGVSSISADVIISADVDNDLIGTANVQLTNAQMLALRATPINITAGVATTALVVHKVAVFFDWTANYTETNDNLTIEFADGTDIVTIEGTGFVDAGADAARVITPQDGALVELTGANVACDTTCGGNACMFGFDDGAADAEVIVVCSGATADRCLCYRPLIPVVNSAVRILNSGDGEFGGGDAANTVSIRIWYSEVPMAAFSTGG